MPVIPGLISPQLLAFLSFFFWIIPCQVPAPRLYMSTHARESKTVMDSGFRLLDSRSFSGLGFQIPVVSKMPDSYSCIPEWKAQDSGFHKQKISKIPDTTCKNSRIPLHVENTCVQPVWHVHFDTINYVIF